jgi:hypothetical protein
MSGTPFSYDPGRQPTAKMIRTCSENGRVSVQPAKRLGGPAESTIIGASACANAVFANGELINALDLDVHLEDVSGPMVLLRDRNGVKQ